MRKSAYKIAVFAGDGIGPEIVGQALKVFPVVASKTGIDFQIEQGLVGGVAYDACGKPLPDESLAMALNADAVLLGAVGGPKWEPLDYAVRPERALLGLREKLGLFANLRPVTVFDELIDSSPLKNDVVQGIDIMIVRELTGGIYFGQPRGIEGEKGSRIGRNTLVYSEEEIVRIARVAFNAARQRRGNLVSVDKANVLEATQLWRDIVTEVGVDYPDVALKHMYVDNCAMQLIRHPSQFDVIVTTNLFGDILSDEASMLTGSIGMLPSASLGSEKAMYEPIHGSAPDIAGQNKANPLATILSVAMMLRHSFKLMAASAWVEGAVKKVLEDGYRTHDICSKGAIVVGTEEMGAEVIKRLQA